MSEQMTAVRRTLAPLLDLRGNPAETAKFMLLAALAALALAAFLWRAPAAPIIEPDSQSYLDFAPFRPAGYPLFLKLTGAQGALLVQPLLAALALAYFGCELLVLTRNFLIAAPATLAIALNPHVLVNHHKIMTESLYVSLLMLLLGLVMHLARKPSAGWMAAASAVAGLMIAVRPAGWFLLPLMLLTALMLRRRVNAKARLFAAAVLPLLAVTFAEHEFRHAWHNGKLVSLLDVALYGKAGMIEAPATGSDAPPVRLLEQDYAPVRKIVGASPDASIRRFLTINYETCIEYSCTSSHGVSSASPEARAAALQRIGANPVGFLGLAWVHYSALWIVYSASHPDAAPIANAFLAANRPLPFEAHIDAFRQEVKPLRIATVMQPVMWLMGLLTAILTLAGLAAIVLRHDLSPPLVVSLLCALAVQGSFVLVSFTGVGIPRYMLAMWPALMLMLACLASAGLAALPAPPLRPRADGV